MDLPAHQLPHLEYAEAVHGLARAIPSGRVLSYGDVAELLGSGGPRQVGRAMQQGPDGTPWWRVIRADGGMTGFLAAEAADHWELEQTPMRRGKVDMARARWHPAAGEWEFIEQLARQLASAKLSEENDGMIP